MTSKNYFVLVIVSRVHSSQGLTLDKPYTIHDWEKMHQKLKYVALSRSSSYENINIM